MYEAFYKSESLSKSELNSLAQLQNRPGIIRFSLLIVIFFLSGYFIIQMWGASWWMVLLSHFFFAVACCNSFACLHESGHGTAFTSRWLGRFAAQIAGIMHIYPASIFRSLHFTHHRHTHIPGLDPEISLGHKPAPTILDKLPTYLAWITGIPLLLYKVTMIIVCAFGLPEKVRSSLFPFIRPEKRIKVFVDSWIVLIIYIPIIYFACTSYSSLWSIITGQIVGHCLLATYLVMEHNGLPHEGHILEKTRSINTNKLVKFIMWNMPYHAEHHAFPAVPFHALPQLHKSIESEIINKQDGIISLHLRTLKGDFKNP